MVINTTKEINKYKKSDNHNISWNKNIDLFFLTTFVKDIQTQIK